MNFAVVCFGTEDREAEKPVAANKTVLAFVSFPGNEIKDLYVHEPGQDVATTPVDSDTKSLPDPPKENTNPPLPPSNVKSRSEAPRQGQRAESGGRGDNRMKKSGGRGRGAHVAAAGTGEHLLSMRERTGQSGSAPVQPQGEFDIQSGLTSFKVASITSVYDLCACVDITL